MESKHTKGIWYWKGQTIYTLNQKDTLTIATVYSPETMYNIRPYNEEKENEEGEANADYIVKCVNAHDELVAVLKSLNAALDRYWNSENKSDSFIKEICRYQSKAELLLDKISLYTPIKQD